MKRDSLVVPRLNFNSSIASIFLVHIFSLVFFQTSVTAQPSWYFNFGFKIGYASGIYGETIAGVELSITRWPESSRPAAGVCFSMEQSRSFVITHVGVEIIGGGVGASFGPTFVTTEDQRRTGLAATFWGGVILMPYLRESWLPGPSDIREFGVFLKIPKRISGQTINL